MHRCAPVVLVALLALPAAAAQPPGLLFHASFDKGMADADFAAGEAGSTLKLEPARHFVVGIRGKGLLQKHGDRCSYAIPGNFETTQGTLSMWVKPLNWDGGVRTFRHFLTIAQSPTCTMLLYIYPIADRDLKTYIRVHSKTPKAATWTAGTATDIFKKGEWVHLATTWDSHEIRQFANGRLVGRNLVGGPLPKLDNGTFTLCPVEYWKHPRWGDPAEQTVCDEVRVFGRPLADDEILDLYALDAPSDTVHLEPKLVVGLEPRYFDNAIDISLRAAHLTNAQAKHVGTVSVTLRDPRGKTLVDHRGALGQGTLVAKLPAWLDGDYVAEATLAAGDLKLTGQARLTKPPTPWLPANKDWRVDRVLPPWSPLKLDGQRVRYWNGQATLDGALPSQLTASGQPLLTGPVRLVAAKAGEWGAPRVVEHTPHRITIEGTGTVGTLAARYHTLMEFDGLIRADITLTPPPAGADLRSLTVEIPIRANVATYYRNPVCREWDGNALTEKQFLPYAWLGNTERGLSWFMESDANWRIGDGQPAMTLRREGDTVMARLHLISTPTQVAKPLTYTLGLEATPVRPLAKNLYTQFFASGPQFKGSSVFVYGWKTQISALNGRLIAHDPAHQRKLVDRWRAKGKEALSYTCTQCTANTSPEYRFFAREWNQPYGATFSGYKRVPDNAPYSIVPTCPRSTFADFLVWCVHQNIANDWGGGIYTDIDGLKPCDNPAHGCGFTDAFGRTGRTWPIYAHRALSRRIYAACADKGKLYFSHAHSKWTAPCNAFNHGWCPGEQFSSKTIENPYFYMDDLPDRTWRSEFHTPTPGVPTFLLVEIGRLGNKQDRIDRGPTESCIAAAMAYGVPLWTGSSNRQVIEEVWATQQAFGMDGVAFVPFWKQKEFTISDPAVRVSYWTKPGKRLVVLANFTKQSRKIELRLATPQRAAVFAPAWNAHDFAAADGVVRLTLPARRGTLIAVEGLRP